MMKLAIRGAGSRPSGGREEDDTLKSVDIASIVDLISEGPIEGLKNGLQSIYLDDVQLQNADGTFNFEKVTVETRPGTLDQSHMSGFAAVENEVSVGVEIKHNMPVVRTVSGSNIDAVRVRISVPALMNTDDKGNTSGTAVEIAIDVQAIGSGVWVEKRADKIEGKTSGQFSKQYRIDLDGDGPWYVRVRRITADATSTKLQNATSWESYTEVVDAKLRYPYSALVGIRFDASQFSSVPKRGYLVRGRIINVPSNYDPRTRGYTGIWDGTFKKAWTNNPAWIWYDLVLHKRYGMGMYIGADQVDKWALYEIGRYCDEMVDDGFGNKEPRLTCNVYIQQAADAYKLLYDLAGVFRGISYWMTGRLTAVADAPRDPEYLFSPANVIDGKFEYAGVSQNSLHSVANVAWSNPENGYSQEVEYVQNPKLVARFGIRPISVTAFGCTSRGQAHRLGRYLLLTEALESEMVSFKVALDGAFLRPGSVIQIADPLRVGGRTAGRVVAGTTTSITVDRFETTGATGERIAIILPDGSVHRRFVTAVAGNTIEWREPLPAAPTSQALWILASSNAPETLWRVTGVKQSGVTVEIAAVAHDPDKYPAIDRDLQLEAKNLVRVAQAPDAPDNVVITEALIPRDGLPVTVVTVSWESTASRCRCRWRQNGGAWSEVETVANSVEIEGATAGSLDVQVIAVGPLQKNSVAASASATITGNAEAPAAPTALALQEAYAGQSLRVRWTASAYAAGYTGRICKSDGTVLRTVALGNVSVWEYASESLRADGGPYRSLIVQVRADGVNGKSSGWAELAVSNPQCAALTGLSVTGGVQCIYAACAVPAETDFAGIRWYLSATSGFTPGSANLVLDGTATSVTLAKLASGATLTGGQTYYLRAAAYDVFGFDGLNLSSEIAVTVRKLPATMLEAQSIGPELLTPDVVEAISNMQALESADLAALAQIDTAKLASYSTELAEARDRVEGLAEGVLESLATSADEWTKRRQLGRSVAAIKEDVEVLADDLSAEVTARQTLAAAHGETAAALVTERNVRATETQALSQDLQDLNVEVAGNKAQTTTALQNLATADTALGQRIDQTNATVVGNKAAVDSSIQALATADTALGQRIDQTNATVAGNKAAVDSSIQALATADTALGWRIDATQSTLGENTAKVSILQQAVNGISAQYAVSIVTDANGVKKVAGFRLMSDGEASAFDVLADAFRVSLPDGTGSKQVFTIVDIDGVSTLAIDGEMVAGKIRSSDSSSFINLDAVGSELFLKIGEKLKVTADGRLDTKRALISRETCVAAGRVVYNGVNGGTAARGFYNPTAGNNPFVRSAQLAVGADPVTFLVWTGVSDAGGYEAGGEVPGFVARAAVAAAECTQAGAAGFGLRCECRIIGQQSLSSGALVGGAASVSLQESMLLIEVSVSVSLISDAVSPAGTVYVTGIDWGLFKLT